MNDIPDETVEIRLFGGPADGRVEEVSPAFVEKRRFYRHREGKNHGRSYTGYPPFTDYSYRPVEYVWEGDLGVAYVHGDEEQHEPAIQKHFGDGVPIVIEDYVEKTR